MIGLPFLLRRLRELRLVGDAGERALVREGILTLADLDLAIAEGRAVAADAALRRAAGVLPAEYRPVTLGRAWDILDAFIDSLTRHCPALQAIEASGPARRAEPIVTGFVIVARAADPALAIESISALPTASNILYRSGSRALVLFEGHEIDVRVATPGFYGSVLFTTTGPAAHVVAVLERGGRQPYASETEVYATAGLPCLPPETRDAADAIDRALRRDVPALVRREDMRGDLHMHTTYSDGRDSLRRMIHAAHALGYEYIAITDHSEHAGAAHTLTDDELGRQRDEIADLRAHAPGMAILHGIEVDILPDGTLDCDDAVLETLDIVLASLHDAAGQDGDQLTRRCLAAIRHPLVSVITHPANQLVGRRPGYDMDYLAIYQAAAETGTALEIDGAPTHLDLSGERAREAVRAGATVVIDSDCHRSRSLDRQMRMGVGTARRGWVEPRHVLNTRAVGDVRAFIARKRAG
ncbi:MAG TPA: PHP domain-containing protein [Vicinamibacterales bacterium]